MQEDINPENEVIGVEALFLDQKGYGPAGLHTRYEWRELCLRNFLNGKRQFLNWQKSWVESITKNLPPVRHSYKVTLKNRQTLTFEPEKASAQTLDFIGESIEGRFWDYIFLEKALFIGATFFGHADFKGAIFHKVNFSKAVFTGRVTFQSAKLGDSPDFSETLFKGTALFDEATLLGFAYFKRAIFFEPASFNSATFGDDESLGDIDFSEVNFKKVSYFDGATFWPCARFENVIFEGDASFRGATFAVSAYFNNARFQEKSDFRGFSQQEIKFSTFQAGVFSFKSSTKFGLEAEFENAVFSNVGHFERVEFCLIPSFLGVSTETTRLEFSGGKNFKNRLRSEDCVKRLGHLKRLADEHGQTDQALNFNALELYAKAGLSTTDWFTKRVTWFYSAVSDYGRSFARPICIYAALLIGTFLLAAGHATFSLPAKDCYGASWHVLSDLRRTTAPCSPAKDDKLHLSGYRAAFEYTLYRAAGVLDFTDNDKATEAVARRLFGESVEPWWMRVWGVFKAIASTALLFLTALGLRNKYRIK